MDVMSVMDLDYPVGSTNLGGTKGKIFYIPASHIKTWTPLLPGVVKISAFPVPKTGKRWAELYYTKDTGGITDKPVGELDGRSYETEIEFLIPQLREELLELIALFTNGPFVFVMMDGNGLARVIGSPELGAYCTASDTTTGKAAKDRNGVMFKFQASGAIPAPVADFSVSLAPGV